jgi:hypothetical protein
MFFSWWFVWKDCDQHVFENKEKSYLLVVDHIKFEVGFFY